jgi:hypothetical protein
VLGRIDAIVAVREHGDRAGAKTAAVGGRVDGQAGDHSEAGGAEVAREPVGKAHDGGRGIARADNDDHRQVERLCSAAPGQERRGVVDHLQAARIVGLAQRDQGHPERGRRRKLTAKRRSTIVWCCRRDYRNGYRTGRMKVLSRGGNLALTYDSQSHA